MSQIYRELASCAPSHHQDVYVFAIVPLADRNLGAITSSDELLLLSRDDLVGSHVSSLRGVPTGITSLVSADVGTMAICAGGEGVVGMFDTRTRSRVADFRTGKPVTALACRGDDVAVGGEAIVSVWDRRQLRMRWQNTEINDEITTLDFHPSRDNLLLSGGDDGLVSVFDTKIAEEEDSLLQAVNHGPIHKAGFLGPSDLYALSSDQNLALHSLTFENPDATEPSPNLIGDLRPIVPCEYVIDVFPAGPEYIVACGSHSKSRVDLIQTDRATGLNLDRRIVLEGAHGGEVIRSVFADEGDGAIFTAGEDGRIAVFRPTGGQAPTAEPSKSAKPKKGNGVEARYKPY